MLPLSVADAVIDEAHKQKLKCYVHAPILSYAKQMLQSGADGLLHGIISDPVDDEFIALMKKNKAVYVPTHTLYEACADLTGWIERVKAYDADKTLDSDLLAQLTSEAAQKQWKQMWDRTSYVGDHLNLLRRNTKTLQFEGIPIVSGTDTGVPGVFLGISSLMEPLLLKEAGLTTSQAMRAATLNAARMLGVGEAFGNADRGRNADLLILEADPLADLRNLYKVRYIVRGGKLFTPKELRQ
jgi:imidazolonepropionase-like amidohydrolase